MPLKTYFPCVFNAEKNTLVCSWYELALRLLLICWGDHDIICVPLPLSQSEEAFYSKYKPSCKCQISAQPNSILFHQQNGKFMSRTRIQCGIIYVAVVTGWVLFILQSIFNYLFFYFGLQFFTLMCPSGNTFFF